MTLILCAHAATIKHIKQITSSINIVTPGWNRHLYEHIGFLTAGVKNGGANESPPNKGPRVSPLHVTLLTTVS